MGQRINKYTRGDYDAIVYIDGTEVIAEDSLGRKIASGVAGTDDATVINAALTSLSSGECCRLIGSFVPSATIAVGSKWLDGVPGFTTLTGSAPVTAITVDQNGMLSNITITGNNYTKGIDVRDGDTKIKHVHIHSMTACTHGVHLYIDKGAGSRGDVTLDDILIEDIEGYGVMTNMVGGSTLDTYYLHRVRAINCGKVAPLSEWVVGIDLLEQGTIDTIIAENCVATGSNESGFYTEGAATTLGNIRILKLINCIAEDNGQKSGGPVFGTGFCLFSDVTDEMSITGGFVKGNIGGGCRFSGAVNSVKLDITSHYNLVQGVQWGFDTVNAGQVRINSDHDVKPIYFWPGTWNNVTYDINISNPQGIAFDTKELTCINQNCLINVNITEPVKDVSLSMIGKITSAVKSRICVHYIASTDTGNGVGFYDCENCDIYIDAVLADKGSAYGYAAKYDGLSQTRSEWNRISCKCDGGRGLSLTRLDECPILVGNLHIRNARYGINVNSNDITDGYAIIDKRTIICENVDTEINEATAGAIRYVTNSGSSTGTGAEQTIAHGLVSTPSRVVIEIPSIGYKGSCTFDATNIYPRVFNGVAFNWSAEV